MRKSAAVLAAWIDRRAIRASIRAKHFSRPWASPPWVRRAPTPDDRGQAGKDLPHIIGYQGVDVGAVGGQIKRILDGIVELRHVLLIRWRYASCRSSLCLRISQSGMIRLKRSKKAGP